MASGNNPSGAKYLWDFGDDSGSSGKSVEHTYSDEGTYTVTLTVVDEDSKVGVAKKEVDILYRNQAPTASLDATYGGLGQQVKVNSIAFFDGGASSDPDGDVLEFEWDFGDGSSSSLLRPNHEYTSIGNYTVTLRLKDNSGQWSDNITSWVDVRDGTPYAYTVPLEDNVFNFGSLVEFSGYGEDVDGFIIEYKWESSIDGLISNSSNYATSALSSGNHTISFRVKDNDHQWSEADNLTLRINSYPEFMNANWDRSEVFRFENVTFPAVLQLHTLQRFPKRSRNHCKTMRF